MRNWTRELLITPLVLVLLAWSIWISPTFSAWVTDGLRQLSGTSSFYHTALSLVRSALPSSAQHFAVDAAISTMFRMGTAMVLGCLLDAIVFGACIFLLKGVYLSSRAMSSLPEWVVDIAGTLLGSFLIVIRGDIQNTAQLLINIALPFVILLFGMRLMINAGSSKRSGMSFRMGYKSRRMLAGVLAGIPCAAAATLMVIFLMLIASRALQPVQMLIASGFFLLVYEITNLLDQLVRVIAR